MTCGRAWLAVAIVAAATAVLSAAGEIRIQPVPSEGRVLVTFSAKDAWTLGSREVLQNSLELRYLYTVELRKPAPFWFFDTVLARADVSSSARFDTLSGRYKLSRMRSGSIVRSEDRQRDQETEVREWLTTFDKIALDPVTPLEPNAEYYVHMVLTIRPQRSFSFGSLLPFGRDENTGRQTFTFLK